jgi:UDP-N-acetylmuramate--alanine ligase
MDITLSDLRSLRTHLLGIGGIGVSALARMLRDGGLPVSGCDVRSSSITEALEKEGIPVQIGHSAAHVQTSDVLVYSTAVPHGNPELAAAQEAGKRVLHRSHLLSLLVDTRRTIGVTGTNGKGTVTSMITWILETAGLAPSYYVGAMCPNLGTNARYRDSRFMVAELDESDGSLTNIHPVMALLNNLEMDHLNYYTSIEHAVETLTRFFNGLPPGATGFFNADCAGAAQVLSCVPNLRTVTFGQSPNAMYRYEPLGFSSRDSCFRVVRGDGAGADPGEFCLQVPGSYNIENAAGAVAVACELGVPAGVVRSALASYQGLENRYTVVAAGACTVVKDYISHPTGIRKVLATARLGNPGRLIAVFKPYRYTMVRYHGKNYAAAFALADETVVTDMWPGGEEPIPGVDTGWLVDQMRGNGCSVSHVADMKDIVGHLASVARPGDWFLFFGGQDLFELADSLAGRLAEEVR